MKELQKNVTGNFAKFENPGDSVLGVLVGVRDIKTKFGDQKVLDLVTHDGDAVAVILTASLVYYDWQQVMGQLVQITFTAWARNKETGRSYKEYKVEYDDVPADWGPAAEKAKAADGVPF